MTQPWRLSLSTPRSLPAQCPTCHPRPPSCHPPPFLNRKKTRRTRTRREPTPPETWSARALRPRLRGPNCAAASELIRARGARARSAAGTSATMHSSSCVRVPRWFLGRCAPRASRTWLPRSPRGPRQCRALRVPRVVAAQAVTSMWRIALCHVLFVTGASRFPAGLQQVADRGCERLQEPPRPRAEHFRRAVRP